MKIVGLTETNPDTGLLINTTNILLWPKPFFFFLFFFFSFFFFFLSLLLFLLLPKTPYQDATDYSLSSLWSYGLKKGY